MKILVVDDSSAMRKIVVRTLRQAGFQNHEYVEADNGHTGLQAVTDNTPDLILSDWNMPEMDGITFLEQLKERGNTIPFGFITTEGTVQMRQKASAAGADFLLQKPFTPEQIEQTVGQFIKN